MTPIPMIPHLDRIPNSNIGVPYVAPAPVTAMFANPRVLGAGYWIHVDGREERTATSSGFLFVEDEAGEVKELHGQAVLGTGISGVIEGMLSLIMNASGQILPIGVASSLSDGSGETFYLRVIHLANVIAVTVGDNDNDLEWHFTSAGQDPFDADADDIDADLLDPTKICTLLLPDTASAHDRIALPNAVARDIETYIRILKVMAPCTARLVALTPPEAEVIRMVGTI